MFDKAPQNHPNGKSYDQASIEHYLIDYTESSSDVLFVTFEGMLAGKKSYAPNRYPWGGKFILGEGHGLLGIKTSKTCWYRNKKLHAALESKTVRDIFSRYKRVIFYGESMGGYAALTFSSLVPNSEVLCFCPQTTMDRSIVTWDDRFKSECGPEVNWSGKYKDASKKLKNIKRAYVIFDPFSSYDLKHFNRLPKSENIIGLRAPFMGHRLSELFSKLDLLKPTVRHFLEGTLEEWFYRAIRSRKGHNDYLANLHYMLARRAVLNCKYNASIHHVQISLQHDINHKDALDLARKLVNYEKTGAFITEK